MEIAVELEEEGEESSWEYEILDDLTLSDRVRIVSRLRLRTLRGPEQDCGRPDDDRSQNGRD